MEVSINEGTPNSWTVYKGKSHLEMDDNNRGIPIYENNLIFKYPFACWIPAKRLFIPGSWHQPSTGVQQAAGGIHAALALPVGGPHSGSLSTAKMANLHEF